MVSVFQAVNILVSLQFGRLLESLLVSPADSDTAAAWIAQLPWELYIMIVLVLFVGVPAVAWPLQGTQPSSDARFVSATFVRDLEFSTTLFEGLQDGLQNLPKYCQAVVVNVVGTTSFLVTQHIGTKLGAQRTPVDGLLMALVGLGISLAVESTVTHADSSFRSNVVQQMLIDAIRQGVNVVVSLQLNRVVEMLTSGSAVDHDTLIWWVAEFPWELYMVIIMLSVLFPSFVAVK
jgi:hypothetical protein